MWLAFMLAILIGGTVPLAGAPAATGGSIARHDGTVESLDSKSQTMVIREFGANARIHHLRVYVTPETHVMLSERNPKATDAEHEFRDSPIRFSDIKLGDFVVVDLTGPGKPDHAQSVVITLRGGA
jgi:hypothetical protein